MYEQFCIMLRKFNITNFLRICCFPGFLRFLVTLGCRTVGSVYLLQKQKSTSVLVCIGKQMMKQDSRPLFRK